MQQFFPLKTRDLEMDVESTMSHKKAGKISYEPEISILKIGIKNRLVNVILFVIY